MRKIAIVIMAAILLLGVVACSAVMGFDIHDYVGSYTVQAQTTVEVEGNIMAVFYTIEDEIVLFAVTDATITEVVEEECQGGNCTEVYKWNVESPTVTANGISQAEVNYGLYQYQETPDFFEGVYYLSDLGLTPITYEDLPWSDHIGKLTDIDNTRKKPAEITRRYQGINYSFWCLVTQNVVDQYMAGALEIGDYVVVTFIEEIPDNTEYNVPIVIGKVYESW